MFHHGRFESPAEVGHRIAFSPASGDSVHEDLPGDLHQPAGCIQNAFRFGHTEHL